MTLNCRNDIMDNFSGFETRTNWNPHTGNQHHIQLYVAVAKALIHSVWVTSLSLSFFYYTHTHMRPHKHTASLWVASLRLVLEMATSPKWHMHPTTRHQPLTRFTKNRSSAQPSPPETKSRRINWTGDLFSQIIPVDVAFCLECILISAIKSTPLVYVHRQWWC